MNVVCCVFLTFDRVTSTYLFPYKEDITRFDFEVAPEDEHLCEHLTSAFVGGKAGEGSQKL